MADGSPQSTGAWEEDRLPRPDPTRLTTDQLIREIGALKSTLEAKFDGRIDVLKTRMDGNDTALVAALQAAKELVGVNNQFATKAIDQQGSAFKASLDSTTATIADVKDRLTRIEGRTSGSGATVATTVAIAAAGAAVFMAVLAYGNSSPKAPVVNLVPKTMDMQKWIPI